MPYRRLFGSIPALMLMLGLGVSAVQAADGSVPLRAVARVALPGASVRFDYTSLDPTADRLYIAHMDANELLVFNLRTRRVIKTSPAPGVHGVLAVPQLGRVYASAANDHQVMTIDSRTGAVIARAPAGDYPDGLAYDPVERHVFVSDESGGVETVLDSGGHRIATVSLGGEAGNVQYDAGSRLAVADVQTRDDIAVIDPRTNRVIRRVALPGCDHDHGLLIDSPHRLAFVACDGNAMLLTLDLRTMKILGRALVGQSRRARLRRLPTTPLRLGRKRHRRRKMPTASRNSGIPRDRGPYRRSRPADAPRLLPAATRLIGRAAAAHHEAPLAARV